MFFRVSNFLTLLFCAVLPLTAEAGGWSSAAYHAAIDAFPSGWKTQSDPARVRLDKEYNTDGYGYAYDEHMNFSVALGQDETIDEAATALEQRGYILAQRCRVSLGESEFPLWIFFHQANDQEVSWLAVALRSGLSYTFEVRGTPADPDLYPDFRSLVAAFRFLPDPRQDAWDALNAGDAGSAYPAFRRLAGADSSDGNALYGLGLAELALGKSSAALGHLQRADAILGLGEARLALGQAQLQTGDPLQAIVTWCSWAQGDAEREKELAPYLDRALAAAPISGRAPQPLHELAWEDFEYLGSTASADLQASLMDARADNLDPAALDRFEANDRLCQAFFSAALEHLRTEGGAPVEAHYLAAAFAISQGLHRAVQAMQASDLAALEKAELSLQEGLETFAAAAPR